MVHHLINLGKKEPMISLFHVTGPEIVVDEDGHLIEYVDVTVLTQYTRDYCKSKGISDSFLQKITRWASRAPRTNRALASAAGSSLQFPAECPKSPFTFPISAANSAPTGRKRCSPA